MNLVWLKPLKSQPVLVLGTDDIASAVGHALFRAGIPVLLARDTKVPVLRREMSFDDALERDVTSLDGVEGRTIPNPFGRFTVWNYSGWVSVTALAEEELLAFGRFRGVVDARMRRREAKSDLRGLGGFAIGLGPGFVAGENVDVAVETAPEAIALVLHAGTTIPAHGRSMTLNGIGAERFGRAPAEGLWRTSHVTGQFVQAGDVVGACAGIAVAAPFAGRLRGLVRDGALAPPGVKLLEVDPRGLDAQWRGIPPRAAEIAAATLAAVRERLAATAELAAP